VVRVDARARAIRCAWQSPYRLWSGAVVVGGRARAIRYACEPPPRIGPYLRYEYIAGGDRKQPGSPGLTSWAYTCHYAALVAYSTLRPYCYRLVTASGSADDPLPARKRAS
jgi:hypothetical protein